VLLHLLPFAFCLLPFACASFAFAKAKAKAQVNQNQNRCAKKIFLYTCFI
jgi:hypothetical protein